MQPLWRVPTRRLTTKVGMRQSGAKRNAARPQQQGRRRGGTRQRSRPRGRAAAQASVARGDPCWPVRVFNAKPSTTTLTTRHSNQPPQDIRTKVFIRTKNSCSFVNFYPFVLILRRMLAANQRKISHATRSPAGHWPSWGTFTLWLITSSWVRRMKVSKMERWSGRTRSRRSSGMTV